MTTTSILSYLAVACSVLVAAQLIAAQTNSYEQTQAQGATAATTMKSTASEALAKIASAANGLSKNDAIVSDATSKIEAAEKDGQAAIDSAVATAKAAYEAAGKPRLSRPTQPLPTEFNCPFCNAEKVCEVKIDKVRRVGTISCRKCLEDFTTPTHHLSEPIDVYSDWIDACEQFNKENSQH
ncbi:transcription elongation factor [Ditylenchus destructor]|nr:transcription elongation factor [Ditylenchus destructor]